VKAHLRIIKQANSNAETKKSLILNLSAILQVKHVSNLARDIDNFQYIRERSKSNFFVVDFDAGCGKYIHPRTGRREYHSRK